MSDKKRGCLKSTAVGCGIALVAASLGLEVKEYDRLAFRQDFFWIGTTLAIACCFHPTHPGMMTSCRYTTVSTGYGLGQLPLRRKYGSQWAMFCWAWATVMLPKIAANTRIACATKGAVHQIIVNFVQNAVDVTTGLAGARIEISCGADNDQTWVRVRDNGPGIAPGDIQRIFEPFFTTKARGQGTGLGLAVSRGIVEKLGGRIEIDNRPGEGCTFRLVLPGQRG